MVNKTPNEGLLRENEYAILEIKKLEEELKETTLKPIEDVTIPKRKRMKGEIEKKILLALAREGAKSYTQFKDEKQVARSNKTILYTLKKLEYLKLIKFKQPETKGPYIFGRRPKFYNLTLLGLLYTLLDEDTWQYIDEIAKCQREHLPLIFGEWKFFNNEGIIEEIIIRFKSALLKIAPGFISYISHSRQYLKKEPELMLFYSHSRFIKKLEKLGVDLSTIKKQIHSIQKALNQSKKFQESLLKEEVKKLYDIVFFGLPEWRFTDEKRKEQIAFISVLKKNDNIRKFMIDRLEVLEKEYKTYLRNIRSWRTIISS